MAYRSDDYHRLARNQTRVKTIMSLIDLACELHSLKYVDRINLVGAAKDGELIETSVAATAKNAMLDAAISSLVASAQELQDQPFEAVDLKKAVAT